MRISEIVVVGYFVYLAAVSWIRPIAPARRGLGIVSAACVIVIVMPLASLPPTPMLSLLRDWLPCLYLLAGYWLPAMLAGPVNTSLEAWLLAFDRRVLDGSRETVAWTARAPRLLLEYLELAYLLCSPIVPAGFLWLSVSGFPQDADVFWTTVLVALYICYGLVPFVPTRPPRAIEGPTAIDRRRLVIRAINLGVLERASIQLNTFPSGHAAGAVATALAVANREPDAGIVFLLLAVSIMTGSVVGRYHYLADAIAGIAVALVSNALARAVISS